MGGIIDLLALLDGWDYREVSGDLVVNNGQTIEVFSENIKGWLILFDVIANDAFVEVTVTMPPESFTILDVTFASLFAVGLTAPNPIPSTVMFSPLFNFSGLPLDSSGLGTMVFNLPYPLPLKKENTLHIAFTLDPQSTQANAQVHYDSAFVQIYQPETFVKSLNEILSGKIAVP